MRESLYKYRPARRAVYLVQYLIPYFQVAFSKKGIGSRNGRTLIIGKFRRLFLSLIPGLGRALQKHYGLAGGCTSCGASCKLLFQCPLWDDKSHLCSIYEDRPHACRLFPNTPADISDRDLVLKSQPCGFTFNPKLPKG